MAERAFEPREVLREVRVGLTPFLRRLRGRARAIKPRIEIARRWIEYYERLSRVRALTKREIERLERHKRNLRVLEARLKLLRAAGRYGRKPTPLTLAELRRAQAKYRVAQAGYLELVAPERAEEIRRKLIPPPDQYRRWTELRRRIEEKCKEYKEVKERIRPLPPEEREAMLKRLGAELRDLYVDAYEALQRGMEFSELIKEWALIRRMPSLSE